MTTIPRLRPFGLARVWAPTGEESAAFDRHAIDELGVPQPVLMENAGRAAAQVVERLFPSGPVVAMVGSGNNGGDALVALRTLSAWGRKVTGVVVADRSDDDGSLLHGWSLELLNDDDLEADGSGLEGVLDSAGVLLDGILGTGIKGAPRERQARAIRALNGASPPVVSLDIPSGVDAGTGAVPGDAVEAVATVAFGWPKLGSLLHPGRARVGRLVAVEISFPPWQPGAGDAQVVTPAWAHRELPRRHTDSHKNAVGSAVIVAGSPGMAGAAIMAGRAALRSGVGLLRLASVPENREVLQKTVPEAIFVDVDDVDSLSRALESSDAVGIGPGIGTDAEAARLLSRVVDSGSVPLLLDADALTLVAGEEGPELEAIAAARDVLVTPHAGEMERISGDSRDQILSDRPGSARRLAADSGACVLLKGLPSVVAEPGGRLLVDAVGTSDLATAGMGDVLTGSAVGFLAQGASAQTAGALALHYTGRAAVRAARGSGMIPDDVILHLPDALSETGAGDTDLALPFLVFDQDAAR